MNKRTLEKILGEIVSQPTAPFHEYHVRGAIQESLKGIKEIRLMEDGFGNLIAHYKKGRSKPQWALGAHMDHPAWVRTKGGGMEFLGGVPEAHRAANIEKIVWYEGFGMWDLPAYERYNGSVVSRACDDLVGCAISVAVLHEMARREIPANFFALFTRAEEVGFIGIHHMLDEGSYPADVTFLSLETSAMVDGAKRDGGPVIRVGDRLSAFDHGSVALLDGLAKELTIPHQRLLLDRGACEASAVLAHGFPAAGISILLDNYHNCGPGTSILAERVEVEDIVRVIRLLVALLEGQHSPDHGQKLRERMDLLEQKNAVHEITARACWPQ